MNMRVSLLVVAVLLVALTLPAHAGERSTIVTEVFRKEKNKTNREVELITTEGDKGRIDIIERDGKKEKGGFYLLTLDGGKTVVMGDKGKSLCTQWDTEDFFRVIGQLIRKAERWANAKITNVKIEKVLEEPGPEILGYPTTHVRIVIEAGLKASVIVKKFKYSLKITDDVWMAQDLELSPIEQQWIKAMSQTGQKQLDQMLAAWNSELPGPILKSETVTLLTDRVNQEQRTKIEKMEVIALEELASGKIPEETFRAPQCEKVSQKEMEEAAKDMLKDTIK